MKIQAKLYTLTSPIAEPDFVELLRKFVYVTMQLK